jgi:hypothetical protein
MKNGASLSRDWPAQSRNMEKADFRATCRQRLHRSESLEAHKSYTCLLVFRVVSCFLPPTRNVRQLQTVTVTKRNAVLHFTVPSISVVPVKVSCHKLRYGNQPATSMTAAGKRAAPRFALINHLKYSGCYMHHLLTLHAVHVGDSVSFPEETGVDCLHRFNRLVCLIEKQRVCCELGSESVYIIQTNIRPCMGRAMAEAVIRRRPSHCISPSSVPGQFMWDCGEQTGSGTDLWWTEWYWGMFLSQSFSFPVSLSFHQCSIPTFIHMLPSPEGQTDEAWRPSYQAMLRQTGGR